VFSSAQKQNKPNPEPANLLQLLHEWFAYQSFFGVRIFYEHSVAVEKVSKQIFGKDSGKNDLTE